MKNIHYKSASAGSGKTHFLTEQLAKDIADGTARPENVILTTFTKLAAAEFKEKAKAVLYKNGKYDEAERLSQAMIGTVHSVANIFVQKYWYLLGISPELKVLDDDAESIYISKSLADLPSTEDINFFNSLIYEFEIKSGQNKPDYSYWKDPLKKTVELIREYRLTEKDIEESEKFSLDIAKQLCNGQEISYSQEDLENFFADGTGKIARNQERRELLEYLKDSKEKGRENSLDFIKKLKKLVELCATPRTGQTEVRDRLFEVVKNLWISPKLYEPQKKYIKRIFALARKWLNTFEEYKKEKRLITYSDMEIYMYELLNKQEVQEDLKSIDFCLYVDEFQDSSPIQVKIFDKLSDLAKKSVWVGDAKQAIYGFRGSDTALTQKITEIISSSKDKGCSSSVLTQSWRSSKKIVSVCNNIFAKGFNGIMDEDKVRLAPVSREKGDLRLWLIDGTNQGDRAVNLAGQIANFIDKYKIKPHDIAVLARTNTQLDIIAQALKLYNIPVCREESVAAGNEIDLIKALLHLISTPVDSVSRATIAYLTEQGYAAGKIFDSRLEYNSKKKDSKGTDAKTAGWLDEIPCIKKLMARSDFYRTQTISTMIESMAAELDLYNIAKRWTDSQGSTENIRNIIDVAKKYEETCLNMSVPATIDGFIEYSQTGFKPAGTQDGVNLLTIHKSKGLEWKHVILCGLNQDNEKKTVRNEIFGVHKYHQKPLSQDNLYPALRICVLQNLYAFGNSNFPGEVIEKIKQAKIPGYENSGFQNSRLFDFAAENRKQEDIRLLYVAMTRPKETLILAADGQEPLSWFKLCGINPQIPAQPQDTENPNAPVDIFGTEDMFIAESNAIFPENWQYQMAENAIIDTSVLAENAPAAYPLRDCQPSAVPGSPDTAVKIIYPENYSAGTETARINLKNVSADEMAEIGSCIHDIFCVLEYINGESRNAKAAAIINDYGFADKINSEQVVQAWDNLANFLSEKYGMAAATYHELPFQYAKEGQIFTGSIDYVYELPENKVILVDYKSFPGRIEMITDKDYEDKKGEKGTHYAGKYKGQFDCYEHALTAAGKTVISKIIYYPVAGIAVEIKDVEH